MKAKSIIVELDKTLESRSARQGILAVDENCRNLKKFLLNLGFKVIDFQSGLSDIEIDYLLSQNKVKYFITLDGDDFFKIRRSSGNRYDILNIHSTIMADPQRVAKTIEGAILYDDLLRGVGYLLDINGKYISDLPKKRKEYMISLKKKK